MVHRELFKENVQSRNVLVLEQKGMPVFDGNEI